MEDTPKRIYHGSVNCRCGFEMRGDGIDALQHAIPGMKIQGPSVRPQGLKEPALPSRIAYIRICTAMKGQLLHSGVVVHREDFGMNASRVIVSANNLVHPVS
jgi:hypothetical protein